MTHFYARYNWRSVAEAQSNQNNQAKTSSSWTLPKRLLAAPRCIQTDVLLLKQCRKEAYNLEQARINPVFHWFYPARGGLWDHQVRKHHHCAWTRERTALNAGILDSVHCSRGTKPLARGGDVNSQAAFDASKRNCRYYVTGDEAFGNKPYDSSFNA